ncbi:cytidylyl-2-hydroxypropylphosphonate hydrolase [Streptomyces sp. NBC_00448]|uniref:cytidylyl-2-hydroxypropylphosphonate hydrolase n=1 Tax=Streptomyces sp. NBC_00448 TaxID=2903652 RepID=UPI002E1E8FB2
MTADLDTTQPDGSNAPRPGRWAPGDHVLWRYRGNGTDEVHICRPVTVVRDEPDLLVVWLAAGTRCIKPVLADGTPLYQEPLATRYTKPRTRVAEEWFGSGVLKLARPGQPWSVWLFWEQDWQFRSWYVNLEEPLNRWSAGVDSQDHFLDISVHPDRNWYWRDEDEFAQAQADGLMPAELAARVRQAGREAVRAIRAWDPPFRDRWQDWRPDPSWPVPELPSDWDRPAV